MAISRFLQVYPSRRERAGRQSVILKNGTAARAPLFFICRDDETLRISARES
jgi:hypothetical protein